MKYLEKEIFDIKKILESNNLLFNKEIQFSILKGNDESKFIYVCIGKKNTMFKLIYKMTKDGKDKKYFHEKYDKKGATLCLFKIKDKDIRYGVFTSVSWDCESGEKKDENAFIFSINNKKIFKTTNPINLFFVMCLWSFFGGNQFRDYELWFSEADNYGFSNNRIYPDKNKECTQGLNTFGLDELEVFQVLNYE